ncbi:unnamed protein product [Didymodactylos carnosus]|uniref:Protein kinase domain-containing protein n=1 Tax=Didymodactylos carnosus TaxID=1234261 RepID=A0A813R0B8_9BILA|nr:unnamed protein product [Didymodactylos carnosus]CAF0814282.1 unnamed protein product [Didymodactylos carnosus]CAF3558658.1 unnamed protein product [Didymodactylos carnosus]CAF3598224.1 unnamed protein product [Didymodactylos carnosus]
MPFWTLISGKLLNNYTLCGQCFHWRRRNLQHQTGHVVVNCTLPGEIDCTPIADKYLTLSSLTDEVKNQIHNGIYCDGGRSCYLEGVISKNHNKSHRMIAHIRSTLPPIHSEDIVLETFLGNGSFGCVFKGKWLSRNKTIACKLIFMDNLDIKNSFEHEQFTYQEVTGFSILKYYGCCSSIFLNHREAKMLILNFMANGNLADVLANKKNILSYRRLTQMACDICSGMSILHQHEIIHRDIRPVNILIDSSYKAFISDMGIARRFNSKMKFTLIGCEQYQPPEFFSKNNNRITEKLDIYTFGLTLYEMFTNGEKHVFDGRSKRAIFRRPSLLFFKLINDCTAVRALMRPSANQMEATFNEICTSFKIDENYMKKTTDEKNNDFKKFLKNYKQQTVRE